ncbi:MAG: hypothetical protein Q4C95_08635 [Planctomycetia bacterium]|nr:hypothetical protein [Planctomycetia bacterium]
MTHFWFKTCGLLVLASVVMLMGCKKGDSLKTAITKGTVTFNGSPAGPGAEVFFQPVGGNAASGDTKSAITAEAAMGKTNDKGEYVLTSMNGEPDKGALPGEYEVSVTWRDVKEPELDPVTHSPVMGKDGKPTVPEITNKIPANYTNPKTSGLTAKVVEGQENVIDFTLTE